jgi:uncharacterized caspase-like protein
MRSILKVKIVTFWVVLSFIFLNMSGCALPGLNGDGTSSKGIQENRGENNHINESERVAGFLKELPANSNRVALVIGNGDYGSLPLSNPINDADDIANLLNELDFSVTSVTNANQAAMDRAIQGFGDKLHGDKIGLFYYSGHGVQYQGKNYMIPLGAISNIDKPSDLNTDAIGLDSVLSMMEKAKNKLNIVVLDACRDNPFPGFKKGDQKPGLAPIGSAEGMLVAYATSPNKAALTSKERNSPYTKHLLRFMENSDLPIELMLKKVRVAVKNETDGEQTPWYAASMEGDFMFVENKH